MLHPSFFRQTKNINNVSFSQRGNVREDSERRFVKNYDVVSPELVAFYLTIIMSSVTEMK